jgi:hypothetical protein
LSRTSAWRPTRKKTRAAHAEALGLTMRLIRFLLLSCCVLLVACPGPTAKRQQYPAEMTGVGDTTTFPLAAAGYRRGKMFIYRPDKLDFSVAYDAYDPSFQNATTFFFYAEASEGELQFEREQQQIARAHPGASLLQATTTTFEKNGRTYSGRVAQYRFNAVFAGQQQDVFSELILIKLPDRYVKVRSTAPISQGPIAQINVRKLMEAVNWAP